MRVALQILERIIRKKQKNKRKKKSLSILHQLRITQIYVEDFIFKKDLTWLSY